MTDTIKEKLLDFRALGSSKVAIPIANPVYASVSRDLHGTSYKRYEERGCKK